MTPDESWYGFDTATDDDRIREIVAARQNCKLEDVEIQTFGGCKLGRKRLEDDDDNSSDGTVGMGAVTGAPGAGPD